MSGYEEDDDRMFCIDNNPMDMTKSEIMDKMRQNRKYHMIELIQK